MCISIDCRIADRAQGGSGLQGCKRPKRTGNACSVLYVYSSRTLGTGVDGGGEACVEIRMNLCSEFFVLHFAFYIEGKVGGMDSGSAVFFSFFLFSFL